MVAAFYPLAFAAQRIGGAEVQVEDLTPAGAEPHDLELTPRQVARVRSADVVLYLGHHFQPAVADAVEGASGETVDLLAGLPLASSTEPEEGLTADPHVWLEPILYARVASRIGDVLDRREAAQRLASRLHNLDAEFRRGLARCARHEVVTSHAAFGYLTKRYGLRQVPITGLNPEAEPTPKDLSRVIGVVKRTHATTIFSEELLSPRVARTVAREVGARTAVLSPIEGLTPDERARGDDYFALMRRNLAAMRRALGCR